MTLRVSGRVVIPSGAPAREAVSIRENGTQQIGVALMGTCLEIDSACIAQGADKVIQCVDTNANTSYSGATEIAFQVCAGTTDGAVLLTKTLTGGDVMLVNDYTFQLTVTATESAALAEGWQAYKASVTLASGAVRRVGAGTFRVIKW